MKAAILGLPNVGKSTLFNALACAEAPTENRPFCTIEPNIARVPVPDPRLDAVAEASGMQRRVYAALELVDVAGLVKGAARGEGLGNRFLAQVREADAAVHVLRCFESSRVAHVSGVVDPVDDAETVNTELMLADLALAERALDAARRRARSGEPELKRRAEALEELCDRLDSGDPPVDDSSPLELLTAMPTLYALNVDERCLDSGGPADRAEAWAAARGASAVRVTAALESDLAAMPAGDQDQLRSGLGLPEGVLERFMRTLCKLLNLNCFFTAGPSEAHAWLIPVGATAWDAAGRVHTDFQKRFVRAEVTRWQDFAGNACAAPELKGRDYKVQDGDVLRFRAS